VKYYRVPVLKQLVTPLRSHLSSFLFCVVIPEVSLKAGLVVMVLGSVC